MRLQVRPLRLAWTTLLTLMVGFAGVSSSAPPGKSPPGKSSPGSSTTSTTAPVAVTYSGQAFAAFVDVLGVVGPMTVSDTGKLPPEGGLQTAKLADVTVPGVLSAQLLIARTSGANGVAESSAALADVNVLNGLVTATFIRAESEATCNGVRGSTEVVGLTVGGNAVTADAFAQSQPVTVEVPAVGVTVTVVINEQTSSTTPGFREITVNAVHVTVTGLVHADVILSSAHSDINGCPSSVGGGGGCPPAPECHDFVTGGGFIAVPNGRANFGFNAGIKPNATEPDGHLNYVDHATGMHVKSTSVTRYTDTSANSPNSRNSRHVEGDAQSNGQR